MSLLFIGFFDQGFEGYDHGNKHCLKYTFIELAYIQVH